MLEACIPGYTQSITIRGASVILTIAIHSFGFKHRQPPQGLHGCGFVFDCRALPNPFWQTNLRPLNGLDAPIIAFFEARPEVAAFAQHAHSLVHYTATVYQQLQREHLNVSFGCTGGRHRSVYLSQWLQQHLQSDLFANTLTHLDVHRSPDLLPDPNAHRA